MNTSRRQPLHRSSRPQAVEDALHLEDLKDRRWARLRNQIITLTTVSVAIVMTVDQGTADATTALLKFLTP